MGRGTDGDAFTRLSRDLRGLMAHGVDRPIDDESFTRWALRVFRYQFEANPAYGRFARGRGATPDTVDHWSAVPAVPATAFKHLRLVSGDPSRVQRVFRTSGTSGTSEGAGRRGEHPVPDLGLYRASLLPNFRAHLLPWNGEAAPVGGVAAAPGDDVAAAQGNGGSHGGGGGIPVLSLVPSPGDRPDSSLGYMVGAVVEELGAEGSGWFVDPEEGIREEAFREALRSAEAHDRPVLLAATGFALVHWLDAMDRHGWRVKLPDGSRIMETGGFKGRSRTVEKEALYRGVHHRLGVPPARIVNEYGMTELLSQFYEPVLREGEAPGGPADRRHRAPPWVRTRVLDPHTLEPVPRGRPGVLCHLDLANAGSVTHVLTEDRGVEVGDGFRVLGRIEGAEARGCSVAMDELLERAGG